MVDGRHLVFVVGVCLMLQKCCAPLGDLYCRFVQLLEGLFPRRLTGTWTHQAAGDGSQAGSYYAHNFSYATTGGRLEFGVLSSLSFLRWLTAVSTPYLPPPFGW